MQSTGLGSKRFTIDSLVCLLKVISISIRYGKADLATSKLLLVGFYCAQECREGLGQLHKNTSLTDNSASQKSFPVLPESSHKSSSVLQAVPARGLQGIQCNHQLLWPLHFLLNTNHICSLCGLPSPHSP